MIKNTQSLYRFLRRKTGFKGLTVKTVFNNLGFSVSESETNLKPISGILLFCSDNSANKIIKGFSSYTETTKFYFRHRKHIVTHLEQNAADTGMDLFLYIQNFGLFKDRKKPNNIEIAKALYARGRKPELQYLYNIFAWYTLEEISHTWQRYIYEHPAMAEKLVA
jgi:hypothetical protein